MMFNVWINVLVVWMATGKRCIVWVFLRIIPVNLLSSLPSFIAIAFDDGIFKVEPLFDKDADIVFEKDLSGKFAKHLSRTLQDKSRDLDLRIKLLDGVDKQFVARRAS